MVSYNYNILRSYLISYLNVSYFDIKFNGFFFFNDNVYYL